MSRHSIACATSCVGGHACGRAIGTWTILAGARGAMGWTAARGKDLASSLEEHALRIRQLVLLEIEPMKGDEFRRGQP
ncbi:MULTISPECIES: hypothetical protein [Xanthomonas]|uniref:hypothetical protein n=1 Tax=Xanthomonas TaxID=338 RepID=UPI00129083D6|nr:MULTISPECIES: hypothetical protein [Xanthomonas]